MLEPFCWKIDFIQKLYHLCLITDQKNSPRQFSSTHILHQATGSRGYTGKTRADGFQTLDFALVRVGGLRLYSRDF